MIDRLPVTIFPNQYGFQNCLYSILNIWVYVHSLHMYKSLSIRSLGNSLRPSDNRNMKSLQYEVHDFCEIRICSVSNYTKRQCATSGNLVPREERGSCWLISSTKDPSRLYDGHSCEVIKLHSISKASTENHTASHTAYNLQGTRRDKRSYSRNKNGSEMGKKKTRIGKKRWQKRRKTARKDAISEPCKSSALCHIKWTPLATRRPPCTV